MSTGSGLYWFGVWVALTPVLFFADVWMAAGVFVLALATFRWMRGVRLHGRVGQEL